MWERFKNWWGGRWVIPDQDPNSSIVFLGGLERPRIALFLEAIGKWAWASFWQIVSSAIAITGLWIAYKKLG